MKKIVYCLLVAVMLSACVGKTKNTETEPRKEGERRVGDIIMVNGEMGIVFAVTTDALHGKVLSVSATSCDWNEAKEWCAQYGLGWRMPSKDELLTIYRKKDILNSSLESNGHMKLSRNFWSLDEYNSNCAWFVYMYDGSTGCDDKCNRIFVRAVSDF